MSARPNPFEGVVGDAGAPTSIEPDPAYDLWRAADRRQAEALSNPPASPTPPPIQLYAETSYLIPRFDEKTKATLAELHTTEENLVKFRHFGFLKGNTLTEKLIFDLGQVRKRNFIDQKYSLTGDATKPATDRAASEEELVSAAQRLLDKLFFVERLINAEDTAENREKLNKAIEEYKTELNTLKDDATHPLASQFAEALEDRKNRLLGTEKLTSLGRTKAGSLGPELKKELGFLLRCLNSTNWLEAKANGDAFAGQIGSTTKIALQTLAKHEFPLTNRPTSTLIIDPPTPGRKVKALLDDQFVQESTDQTDRVLTQRFCTYLNYGEKPSTIAPMNAILSNSFNPRLRWGRRGGVDHPSNKKSKQKFMAFAALRALSIGADNIAGLFAGPITIDYFRKREAQLRYANEPSKDSPEHREWRLLRELTPGKTFLNQASSVTSKVVASSLSAGVYTGKALFDGVADLATDNPLGRKLRKKNKLTPKNAQAEALNILSALNDKKNSSLQVGTPAFAGARRSDESILSPPIAPDTYQANDLLGFSSQLMKNITADFNLFMETNPSTLALLASMSAGMLVFPTALKGLIGNLHLDFLAEHISTILPEGASRDFTEKALLVYIMKKLHITDLSSLSSLDLSKLTPASIPAPSTPPSINPYRIDAELKSPGLEAETKTNSCTTRLQVDPVLWEILNSYEQLPSLDSIQKKDLCRALLLLYPDHPQFTDCVIRQCQKTNDITRLGVTLPQSPLSESLVHAVHHAINAVDVLLSLPRRVLEKALKKESTTQLSDATTRALLEDSLLKIGTALGKIGGVAKDTSIAVLKLIPRILDQLGLTLTSLRSLMQQYVPETSREPLSPEARAKNVEAIRARAELDELLSKDVIIEFIENLKILHQGRDIPVKEAEKIHSVPLTPLSATSTGVSSPGSGHGETKAGYIDSGAGTGLSQSPASTPQAVNTHRPVTVTPLPLATPRGISIIIGEGNTRSVTPATRTPRPRSQIRTVNVAPASPKAMGNRPPEGAMPVEPRPRRLPTLPSTTPFRNSPLNRESTPGKHIDSAPPSSV